MTTIKIRTAQGLTDFALAEVTSYVSHAFRAMIPIAALFFQLVNDTPISEQTGRWNRGDELGQTWIFVLEKQK